MRAQPAASLAEVIEDAARRLADDPAGAAELAALILQRVPGDPRAQLILASARRRQDDAAGARALLEPLARAYPKAAKTHYELGLALAGLEDRAGAVVALRHSVGLDREQPEAWRALGDLLFTAGDVRGAEAAFAEQLRASLGEPELKAAADALAEDDAACAEPILAAYLRRRPGDPAALRLFGDALGRLGRYIDAEAVLAEALVLDPAYDGARFTLATVLFQQQKAVEALAHVRDLLAREPANPAYRNLFAACLSLVGEPEEVEAVHRALLAEYPDQAQVWLNSGHALRTVRRFPEAVAAYRRAIALQPAFGDAYWALANLKLAALDDREVATLRAELARPGQRSSDRLHMHYALGKAQEERGDDLAAFDNYAAGAALRRAGAPYSADKTSADVERRVRQFTSTAFADRRGGGTPASDPIFIVGLPRSGSTLIEQVLASHPEVEGTMELPDLGLVARALAGGAEDDVAPLLKLDATARTEAGVRYLRSAAVHRKLGRPLFTDKMPNNFMHVGLIQLILPNAKIIDVRRHPMAVGWAVFKQHFAQGQAFSYDLTDIGRYYRDYATLMAHFDAVLPGRVHRVIYEDVVNDTEAQVRQLLAYCNLPFDAACLRFYENDRPVKTVSSEQVRRPIFRDGLEQWRRFEPWLDPLKQALGPALHDWRS